jgi:CheY-like chemotaxis protein
VSKTFLIVEDESIIAEDLRHTVTKLGYTYVGRVATGPDAVDKARALTPDIILMDVRLRGRMTGYEAADVILNHRPVAIVFLSAFSPMSPLAAGCVFVAKPFSPEPLRNAIETALRETPCHSSQS